MEIATIPIITALVFGVITAYKAAFVSEKAKQIIPIIAAALGTALGVLAFYAVPEIFVAENVFAAALIGLASGLAAVGVHQIYKQQTK